MSLTGRPIRPPLALICPGQICIASNADFPPAARPPVSAMPKPIVIGSAARAAVEAARPKMSANARSQAGRFWVISPPNRIIVLLRHPGPPSAQRPVRPGPRRRASLPQEVAGDDDAHDLVGAFEDLVDAQITQIALDREIPEIAVAAVQLQRLVGDVEPGIGGDALGHRAMQRRLRVALVEARRGAP